ncbi:MAG: ABC transporter substrate-binding protein [Candidatus Bathyarchaeia archaeon]
MNSFRRCLLTLMTLFTISGAIFTPRTASGESSDYPTWGPRVNYLQFIIYGTYEATSAALRRGDIDLMDWPLDYDTYMAIKDDPNFVIEPLVMYDCYDIDINNLRWPTSDYRFRKAIAHLIDYETFYTNVLRAYAGELMDNIIWSQWKKWYNPYAPKYWYDRDFALQILANAGYKDWDGDKLLEWKAPNGTIYELPKLEFYAREDDPLRRALGDMLNAELNAIGIPTYYVVAQRSVCWMHAYQKYDYHLYTAGMGPFRDPQFLYDYYHSKYATPDIPWCMNNVFFRNATYDYWVEQMKFAPDEATAIKACKKAQEIFMDQVPLIPVYHSAGSKAYRRYYGRHTGEQAYWGLPWKGFVNSIIPAVDSGINDYWTLLGAHPGDVSRGGTLRYGWISDVDHVNPITQYSVWDAYLMAELYSTLIMYDPYTGDVIPWLAKDWRIETWNYEGKNATKLTFYLRAGLRWSDGSPLNSSDVAFTMKYLYDAVSPAWYPYVENIHNINTATPHIETPDATTVTIYYTVQSVWCLTWAGDVPIIPKKVWGNIPPKLCEQQGEFVKTGNLTVSGPYVIAGYKKGEWWLLRANPYFFKYAPLHDLRLKVVKSVKTIACQGYDTSIMVNVSNVGDVDETVTIKLYANNTIIGSKNVFIESGKTLNVSFTWDTSGFTKGNYTIRAEAEPVPGETDTADNTLMDGWIFISIAGDVNADCKVDLKDIFAIALAYGAYPGHPKWNPNLDINNDKKIDLKDYFAAAKQYGATW